MYHFSRQRCSQVTTVLYCERADLWVSDILKRGDDFLHRCSSSYLRGEGRGGRGRERRTEREGERGERRNERGRRREASKERKKCLINPREGGRVGGKGDEVIVHIRQSN